MHTCKKRFYVVGLAVVLALELANETHTTDIHRVWGRGHCTLFSLPNAQGVASQ